MANLQSLWKFLAVQYLPLEVIHSGVIERVLQTRQWRIWRRCYKRATDSAARVPNSDWYQRSRMTASSKSASRDQDEDWWHWRTGHWHAWKSLVRQRQMQQHNHEWATEIRGMLSGGWSLRHRVYSRDTRTCTLKQLPSELDCSL